MPVIFKPIESKYFSKKIFCEFLGYLVKDFVDLHASSNANGDLYGVKVVMEGETFSLGDSEYEGEIYIAFDEASRANQEWLRMNKYDSTGQFWLDFNLNITLKREKTSPFRVGNIENYLIQAFCFNSNSDGTEIPYEKTLNSGFGAKTLKSNLLMNKVQSSQASIDEVYVTNTTKIQFLIQI